MSESTLEQILKLATQKAEAVEIYYLSTQETPIKFENNCLKSLQTKAQQGVALRLIYQGKLGFASSTDLTRIEDLVEGAIQTAKVSETAQFKFASSYNFNYPKLEFNLPQVNELITSGEEIIEKIHNYNPDILVNIDFNIQNKNIKILTNTDVYAQRFNQLVNVSISGNLVRNEDFLQISTSDAISDRTLDINKLLEKLIQKYRWAENSAKITTGNFPVFFTPTAVGKTIARLFKTVLSGQLVVQKASPLTNKVGETMFDPRFTLFEDPNIVLYACPFDDEGIPTTVKTFIEAGTLKSFYWDQQWAARAGRKSTGNGFRDGLSQPTPSLVNLSINPGQASPRELISNIKEGLIIDQVLGASKSNQLAGEFSVNLDLGYKVEKGEITGRVKNTMVAGNIFEAFQNLVDIGNFPELVGNSYYLPCIVFQNLGVATREA
ncbi:MULTISPECIES: TldD/PmbA family protein [Okeania]|uniref:TldD/PmbA family protein n=1 Tax=Okeania hirsuta TaxID=1458930 RepID=A0A3N6PES0_9CYAN|nr:MULTISPECIES: metallopeptidase TldD-related protein [Okeania]NET12198.1 TldD/PmbA family protein [Okeania sp. SIO1H6]NES75458.1 TldD/PmbA family protein [Okeania sp. SIO1H4]NES88793.1 TldD/PmbA family protein [Okeania sp. SIO2B9]NET17881.1 TldD/PmbA family protein [Okeania sp. SIO1H5]NET77298.1 TldD/PmbA family protein [Okeania sp. SIO1F9]